MANYYYSGQGSLYAGARTATGGPAGLLPLGNIPELTLNIETTKFEHKESESGNRLIDLTLVQEKKGTIEFTLENLNIENMALGLWGTSAVVAGGTESADAFTIPGTATAGMRFPLKHPGVTNTVTDSGGAPGPLVQGTDFTLDAANGTIELTAAGVTKIAGSDYSFSGGYDYDGYDKVDAFTEVSAPERYLRFEGLNTVDNTRVLIDVFKAQFDPLTGYGLINEEVGSVSMVGNLLADSLQPQGQSQFFRQVNAG